jgi:hypothetical protein
MYLHMDFKNVYLNMTPPIGAPKATETPAAAEALKISRFFASLYPYFGNRYENIFPMQQAKCTIGPSLPKLRPAIVHVGKQVRQYLINIYRMPMQG